MNSADKDTILESFQSYSDNFQTGVFLAPRKKGANGFDYDANKAFRFKTDAPEIVYFEKTSTAFVFEKVKFRRTVTGD